MRDLIERLRAVKWEVADDGDRTPDDPAHKCVFVDMRPEDFRALLREAADALEAAQMGLRREESDHERTIDQRDAAEDALSRMFQAVTGRPAEWSSAWGYVDAIEEVEEHVAALEAAREDGWQPIETAPKDGTRVLLWYEWHDLPVVGDFRHGRWWSVHSLGGNLVYNKDEVLMPIATARPAHWRPLPAPPAIDQAMKE